MANRYWVGGAGTWDTTTTTHWSATSGGTGGASAPTSIDNVFFDALSNATAYTVTVSGAGNCLDWTANPPASGIYTFTMDNATVNVYGSVYISTSTNVRWTHSGTVNFYAASGNKTVNFGYPGTVGAISGSGSGGVSFLGNGTTGATWTLLSGMGFLGNGTSIGVSHTAGTLNLGTNGNTIPGLRFSSTGDNVRVLYLGNSVIYGGQTGDGFVLSGNNLYFDAGTSTIQTGIFSGGNRIFYNLICVPFDPINRPQYQVTAIDGGSFNNISVTSDTKVYLTFTNNTIIRGSLIVQQIASAPRCTIRSPVAIGVTSNLIINGSTNLTNVDFQDINIIGAAAPISGTRLGDLKGNSGITFTPKTVYWNLAGSQNWSSIAWALTSGGTPDANNFPMPQDTCVFDNAVSVGTITFNASYNIGTIDMSARTLPITLATSSSQVCYGNWIHGIGTRILGTGTLVFSGRNSQNITSLGATIPWQITIDSIGGTVNLLSALTTTSTTFYLTNGNLNLNNYTLTARSFSSTGSNIRSLQNCANITLFGNSIWIWETSTTTNMIFTGIPNVNLVYTGSVGSRTINGGSLGPSFPANFNVIDGTDTVTITAGVYNLDFTGFKGTLSNSPSTGIFGSLKLSSQMTVQSGTNVLYFPVYTGPSLYAPKDCTLDTAGKTLDFPVTFSTQASYLLRNNLEIGPTRTLILAQGTLDLNGFNLSTGLFQSSGGTPRLLNIGNSSFILSGTNATIWDTSASTNLSIFANNPINCTGNITTGTRTINASSVVPVDFNILSGIDTVTISGAHSVNYTGWQGTIGASNINGNVIFGAGSLSTTNLLTLNATAGVKTITSNGNIINFPLTINGVGGSYVLQDALTLGNPSVAGGAFTISNGTFDANDYNVTSYGFSSTGTFYIRSGTITLTGSTGTLNFNGTIPQHTGSILLSNNSAILRTFNGNGLTFTKLIIGGVGDNSVSTINIIGNNTFLELNSTKTSAHTINFQAGSTTNIKKWSITGSPGKFVTILGGGAGLTCYLNLLERVTNVDYLIINGINITRGEFYAGRNSINVALNGSNAPLFFTDAPTVPKTYYCVADGTWNVTNTTIWSLTSGGPGGAGSPTSIDNVIFDSTRTITITTTAARCNNLTISSNAGTVTLGAASETLYIFGSLDNQIITKLSPATGLRILCIPYFSSTKSGNKINFNGSGPSNSVYFDGIGGSWQLTSYMDGVSYGVATLLLINGTLNTAGNPLSVGSFNSNYTTNRTLLSGISTMNLTSATPWTINPINFNYVAQALKII